MVATFGALLTLLPLVVGATAATTAGVVLFTGADISEYAIFTSKAILQYIQFRIKYISM
jgi:hypothetical protein